MTEFDANDVAIARAEKVGLGDLVIAGLLALLTGVGLWIWEYAGLYPAIWSDAAVASGVRPAVAVMPGLFTAVARVVYGVFGLSAGEGVLRTLGHCVLALTVAEVYSVLREMLVFIMRARPQYSVRRMRVIRLASAIGALGFAVSDPVWSAGQCLGENLILLALLMTAIECFLIFLRKGDIRYAYGCAVVSGLLAAETPLGLVMPVLFVMLNAVVVKTLPSIESPLFKPALMEVGKWHMTFLYFVSLLAGIGLNCWQYVENGGLEAIDETLGALPLAYVLGYWNALLSATGPAAGLLWLGICLMPFVVTSIRFPAAADEGQFLSYGTGLVFFFCGVLAFSQCASLPALWFWSYFPVNSQILMMLGNFFCAATLASGVAILGIDALCRNHVKLAKQIYGNEDDMDIGETMSKSRLTVVLRRLGVVFIPVVIVVALLPGRVKTVQRQMLAIITDAIDEMVREAGEAKYLFTDGNLDTAIERVSAREGGALKCLSLMGGSGAMATYLRTRGIPEGEELFSFQFDTGMGLRTWIRDKPERLKDAAAQMGFDLWKRDGKKIPPMGGLLSRPAGFPDEARRQAGIAAAHGLIARVFAALEGGGLRQCSDAQVKAAFLNVMWRLARMCKYRGEAEDMAGHVDAAIEEAGLSKRLDDANETYQDVLKTVEQRNEQLLQKMTPREGLQLALVRADFTMGHIYAETILNAEPENPDANFAMGMFYLKERQLSRAEAYLKRCLIQRPGEPAVYNNLAMIQIELGKLDAAEVNVKKALKLLPDSAAIRATEKAVEAARKKTGDTPPAAK